jgi:hypothetical protein
MRRPCIQGCFPLASASVSITTLMPFDPDGQTPFMLVHHVG